MTETFIRTTPLQRLLISLLLGVSLLVSACSGQPLNTREKGALLGTGLGAGGGAIIGSAVGHPAAGALIGGATGLIGGGLIGDAMMGIENRQRRLSRRQARLHRRVVRQGAEIRRLRAQMAEE